MGRLVNMQCTCSKQTLPTGVHSICRWCAGNFAETPGFRGGNFAANLKREVSHTKLTDLEISPRLYRGSETFQATCPATQQPQVWIDPLPPPPPPRRNTETGLEK